MAKKYCRPENGEPILLQAEQYDELIPPSNGFYSSSTEYSFLVSELTTRFSHGLAPLALDQRTSVSDVRGEPVSGRGAV
jgi:hypothetical protein